LVFRLQANFLFLFTANLQEVYTVFLAKPKSIGGGYFQLKFGHFWKKNGYVSNSVLQHSVIEHNLAMTKYRYPLTLSLPLHFKAIFQVNLG